MVSNPESAARKGLLVILTRAVPGLCFEQKPVKKGSCPQYKHLVFSIFSCCFTWFTWLLILYCLCSRIILCQLNQSLAALHFNLFERVKGCFPVLGCLCLCGSLAAK